MGCIGIKAYHFAKGDERTQPPALDKLWIDIGAKDKADAERMGIQVGTPVTLYNPPHCLGNDRYAVRRWMTGWGVRRYWASPRPSPPHRSISRYSGRVGTGRVQYSRHYSRFTTRAPRPAIGIDITPSCDTPDLQDYSDVRVNHGVGITCLNYHGRGTLAGLITPPRLLRMLETTAHENNILVQREVAPASSPKPATFRLNWTVFPAPVFLFPAAIPIRQPKSPACATRLIVSVY